MTKTVYLVGGAVRDKLLGLDPKDLDYVVVGSSPEEMIAQGFKEVGAGFPVFLHPVTGDEYAMARREVKTGVGYKGFDFEFGPDVTLEEDLMRRDLTINAIALNESTGEIFDPYNGEEDLRNGVLRHVSIAFAEDPLRVLRVARFVARYGFSVDSTTIELCKQLVNSGELDQLTNERVWKELSRMMMEPHINAAFDFMVAAEVSNSKSVQMFLDFAEIGLYDDGDKHCSEHRWAIVGNISGMVTKSLLWPVVPVDVRVRVSYADSLIFMAKTINSYKNVDEYAKSVVVWAWTASKFDGAKELRDRVLTDIGKAHLIKSMEKEMAKIDILPYKDLVQEAKSIGADIGDFINEKRMSVVDGNWYHEKEKEKTA